VDVRVANQRATVPATGKGQQIYLVEHKPIRGSARRQHKRTKSEIVEIDDRHADRNILPTGGIKKHCRKYPNVFIRGRGGPSKEWSYANSEDFEKRGTKTLGGRTATAGGEKDRTEKPWGRKHGENQE